MNVDNVRKIMSQVGQVKKVDVREGEVLSGEGRIILFLYERLSDFYHTRGKVVDVQRPRGWKGSGLGEWSIIGAKGTSSSDRCVNKESRALIEDNGRVVVVDLTNKLVEEEGKRWGKSTSLDEVVVRVGDLGGQGMDVNVLEDGRRGQLKEVEDELNIKLNMEETYWQHWARTNCLAQDNGNTPVFHTYASARQKSNRIEGFVRSDGVWVQESQEMMAEVSNFYRGLFTALNPSKDDIMNMLNFVNVDLSERSQILLDTSFTPTEVQIELS
ncbi:hypothetical protein C2S52_014682 [Perilla frutescens var. hirtella]|nr:hypothetical protein C2S52_014682 [Perilla frutescens var. hirtella]